MKRFLWAWTDQEGPLSRLGLFRVVLAVMLGRHTLSLLTDCLERGFYGSRYHLPYFDWLPQPTEAGYLTLLSCMLVAAVLVGIGFQARQVCLAAFVMATYHLFLNQIWFRHNRNFMVVLLLLACLAPLGVAASVDAVRLPPDRRGWGPTWSFFLIRLQMTLVYCASAGSKLLDPDWRSGNVLIARAGGDQPGWWALASAGAIATELLLAFALWTRTFRRAALWGGILFHTYIELRYSILVFSYLSMATYFLAIPPQTRTCTLVVDPRNGRHRRLAGWVIALNWLDKVRVVQSPGARLRVAHATEGTFNGWMAFAILGRALPVTFLLVYPLSLLRHFMPRREEPPPAGDEYVPGPLRWQEILLPNLAGAAFLEVGFLLGIKALRGQILGTLLFKDKLTWSCAVAIALALYGTFHRLQMGTSAASAERNPA